MNRNDYDKQLAIWAKSHYWDSLEKDKDLILRHLWTFVGDPDAVCPNCGGILDLVSMCRRDTSCRYRKYH